MDDTGAALTTIATRVAEMDGLIAEIAGSAQEQSTALAQVNSAINQMDQVTQQNAAMVEEATAAASSLQSEASQLSALVQRFNTGSTSATDAQSTNPQIRPVARLVPRLVGNTALKSAEWESV